VKKDRTLVGITINKFKGISPTFFLKLVQKMGLEFVEISRPVFDDIDEFVKNIGTIETGFHLPNSHDDGFDLSCDERDEEIQELIRLINTYQKDLHVKYCLSHPPEKRRTASSEDAATDYLLTNLARLEPPIILENVQSWPQERFDAFYRRAKERLGEKLLGQCFDASHYYLQGENPVAFLQQSNGEIKFMHLSDCKADYDAHLPFDMGGTLPVDEILATLKKQNYRGIINLELLPRNLSDMKPLIQSYLKVLRTFRRFKYYKSKVKIMRHQSILKKTFKKVF